MRISDWSSDVCSSDLAKPQVIGVVPIETVVAAVRAKVLPASDEPPFTRTVAPVTKSSVSSRSVARDHPLADATKMPFSTGAVWLFTSTRPPLPPRPPSMTLRPERTRLSVVAQPPGHHSPPTPPAHSLTRHNLRP